MNKNTGFTTNEISVNSFGGTELAARSLEPLIPAKLLSEFQIISSRVRELDPTKIRILWLHDLPEDPESSKLKDPEFRKQFHHLVFVSNWQYERYRTVLQIPYDQNCSVIPVGITPTRQLDISKDKPTDVIRMAYTSTPQRGLDILLATFDALVKARPDINIELDIFSSFKVYGWEQKDVEFKPLFDFCRKHPKINYKGFVPNEELRKSLESTHIWAYPSTWAETSCRALVEAMSAQLVCVHPNYGALPETACGQTLMYDGDTDKSVHSKLFFYALNNAVDLWLEKDPLINKKRDTYLTTSKYHTDFVYNLNRAAQTWLNLLAQLSDKYTDTTSRVISKVQAPVFKYSTH